MAIDADLDAGLIDEAQARARRELVAREAEFYGAMDGAARFSQRDALATILITAINIVAGFLIGVFQLDIPFSEALKTYTILTVGDGLVTMIPSLLVSVAGGMVATRASSGTSLGVDLARQLLSRSRAAVDRLRRDVAAGPDSRPAQILLLPHGRRAVAMAGAPRQSRRRETTPAVTPATKKPGTAAEHSKTLLKLDELSLEVGYALVPLVDRRRAASCCPRIRALRSTWPCNWASSFLPFTSPTTCASSPASMSSRCAAWKSPAGRWPRIACWPSAPSRPAAA